MRIGGLNVEFCNVCVEEFELVSIKGVELDVEQGHSFSVELNCVCYKRVAGVVFVHRRRSLTTAFVSVPKPNATGLLTIHNVEKVFVSQLSRMPGVRITASAEGGFDVSLMASSKRVLAAHKIGSQSWFSTRLAPKVDCVQGLMALGIKRNHVLDVAFGRELLVYLKGRWWKLEHKRGAPNLNSIKYGKRRMSRPSPVFKRIETKRKLMTASSVVGPNGSVVLLAGSEFKYCCSGQFGVVAVTACSDEAKAVLATSTAAVPNWINRLDFMSIDFANAGREAFNGLVGQRYGPEFDCLTKRDLILLWKLVASCSAKTLANDSSLRVVKGCGDVILDLIGFGLKNLSKLKFSAVCEFESALAAAFKKPQAAINSLFASSELCQFGEQLNSLTELSHTLRLSYMGEGGVTSRTATEGLRDVKRWHFGKVCPIESPEGQNIGLVLAYAMYSSVSPSGLIQTAFCKVLNGKASGQLCHLSCFGERFCVVAALDSSLVRPRVLASTRGKVFRIRLNKVELRYVSPAQLFSPAVNLIPFLGHSDATRALMAANMLKQAIPLIAPMAPIVGTGLERDVMKCCGHNLVAETNSVVVYADATKVVVYQFGLGKYKTYELEPTRFTNQGTCFRHRVSVMPGQLLKPNDVIADCQSSSQSEVALGANLLVAFMSWGGHNYEDAVVLSEDVVARGLFQSLHTLELETKVVKTPLGNEILTNKLFKPEANLVNKRNLTTLGLIRVGSTVSEGDVLVGKLTPAFVSCNQLEYSSSSLKVPAGISWATVVDVSVASSKLGRQGVDIKKYAFRYNLIRKEFARRVYDLSKRCVLTCYKNIACDIFCFVSWELETQRALNELYNSYCDEVGVLIDQYFCEVNSSVGYDFKDGAGGTDVVDVVKVKLLIRKSIQAGDKISGRHGNKGVISQVVLTADMPFMEDGTPVDMILNPLSVPSRMNLGQVLEAHLGLISYKWGLEFKRVLELRTLLKDDELALKLALAKLSEVYPNKSFVGWSASAVMELVRQLSSGVKLACHPFTKISDRSIDTLFKRVGLNDASGQLKLYDGKTGLAFDRKITVGYVHILKLNHLVDDKVTARATGPYSIVVQQPLKGKTNSGGQRLGEMEVWALQSYGVAFVLQEALTVKSDDVRGRSKVGAAILEEEPVVNTTWNESFLVLIKEMCSLCLNVELDTEADRR
ncbi:MAG: hypothetical protein P3M73_00065 [Candidatus Hodgkinia cicadicola]|nr:MAG: hypothetical protein P3M73_00065 [Candidatus Hodgkinia cicadicola]